MKEKEQYLKLKYHFILITLFMVSYVNAQIDSVNQLILKETNDVKKIEILLQSCKTYSNSQITLQFSKQAYSIANQIKNGRLVAKTAEQVAISYFVNQETDSVKKYLTIAEDLYLNNNDKVGLYDILFYHEL